MFAMFADGTTTFDMIVNMMPCCSNVDTMQLLCSRNARSIIVHELQVHNLILHTNTSNAQLNRALLTAQ